MKHIEKQTDMQYVKLYKKKKKRIKREKIWMHCRQLTDKTVKMQQNRNK